MGDKTRKQELSRDMNALSSITDRLTFGGGVTRFTNEAIIMSETAG